MIKTSVPILPAADIEATRSFCVQKLGFQVDNVYPDYLMVSRDGVSLHFLRCPERKVAEWTSCYVWVTEIDVLFAAYLEAGIVHPNGHVEDKPWGVREFTALTPDGVALRFGQG